MGASCVGRPRQGADLMKKDQPQKRYESKKVMEKGLVGESEGAARLKIDKSLLTCGICMVGYDLTEREPQIVCGNLHTFCKSCTGMVLKHSGCPECRRPLIAPTRNRNIFQLIEDNQAALREGKVQEVPLGDEDEYFRVQLTMDKDNPFNSSFWDKEGMIMKVADDRVWEGFVSNQVIQSHRRCSFSVRVVTSLCNNIKIGLVGQGYKLERNKTCKQAVVYHLADGMILSGLPNRQGSQWQKKGQPIKRKGGVLIQVCVQPSRHTVVWKVDGEAVGQGMLSGYLKSNSCVAYIMMCHKNDIVELNP